MSHDGVLRCGDRRKCSGSAAMIMICCPKWQLNLELFRSCFGRIRRLKCHWDDLRWLSDGTLRLRCGDRRSAAEVLPRMIWLSAMV
eukprot:scaffold9965_cov69-Cyclotella_meneghiniana.AAC.18